MPTSSPTSTVGDLPAELTSFVGRRGELAQVRSLLSQSRLVTLTGFGGIGKTRLALRSATMLRRAYPDGVWFAPLGDLPEGGLLAETVAAALRVPGQPQRTSQELLVEFLRHRAVLLVLDNCEHVLGACAALVDELLRQCPRLHILATSREPLRLDGETVHALSPLSIPDLIDDSIPLIRIEAIRLFLDRARSVDLDFDITPDNRQAIAGICRRLEGIPLALELAAVRLRAMSPSDLFERLTDQWQLLDMGSRGSPARQRTMEACISWSYHLCSAEEREVWARLAVFSGGFELDAAERVCADGAPGLGREQVTRALLALVEKAILIRSEQDGHVRYRMLEPVRQHGEGRLRELGHLVAMRRKHRDWCTDLVSRAHREWLSPSQITWMRRLRREQPNLRAALDFCITEPGESAAGLHIAALLQPFAVAYGLFRQGRYWFDRLLPGATEPTMVRLLGLRAASVMAVLADDLDTATAWLEEGSRLAADLGEPAISLITQAWGLRAMFAGELDSAVSSYEQALDGFRSSGNQMEQAHTLELLGITYAFLGDAERALAGHRECLAMTERAGESWYRSNSLWQVGLSAWKEGKSEEASRMEKESLRLKRLMDDQFGIALCVEALAWIAAADDPMRAAALLGAGSALWKEMDASTTMWPDFHGLHTTCVADVRRSLGDAYPPAFESGARLDRASAVGLALGERDPESAYVTPAAGQEKGILTRRQREIAALVAQGLSNQDIADRLVISRRTAETHVENILVKLGFTSRTQVAVWMAGENGADDRG